MGQAKRRGTREERIAQATEARERADEAWREQERKRRLAFERLPAEQRERIEHEERRRNWANLRIAAMLNLIAPRY